MEQGLHEVVELIATVIELSGAGLERAVVVALVAYDVAYIGEAHQHARSVLVAQAALHAIFAKRLTGNLAGVLHFVAQFVNQIFFLHLFTL